MSQLSFPFVSAEKSSRDRAVDEWKAAAAGPTEARSLHRHLGSYARQLPWNVGQLRHGAEDPRVVERAGSRLRRRPAASFLWGRRRPHDLVQVGFDAIVCISVERGSHIAVRTNKKTLPVLEAELVLGIAQLGLRSDGRGPYSGSRRRSAALDRGGAKKRPLRPRHDVEQAALLSCRPDQQRIGHTGACRNQPRTLSAFERQGGRKIADIQLLRFWAAFQAVLLTVAVEQPARKAKNLCGDRPSLLRIGVEQTIGRPPEDGGELPSEVVGVLYACSAATRRYYIIKQQHL